MTWQVCNKASEESIVSKFSIFIHKIDTNLQQKMLLQELPLLYGIFITSFAVSYNLLLVFISSYHRRMWFALYIFFPMAQQPLEGQGRFIIEASRSHSMTHTRHDFSVLGISPGDLKLTIHNTQKERHSCSRSDSNLQSQQAIGRRPTPFFIVQWTIFFGIIV